MTNAFVKQWVGILLMPKIDRAHKNDLTPKIWEEMCLREIFYCTLIFHITFIFIKTMPHDLLVQMVYSTLSQCVMKNSSQLEFSQYGNHYFRNIINFTCGCISCNWMWSWLTEWYTVHCILLQGLVKRHMMKDLERSKCKDVHYIIKL